MIRLYAASVQMYHRFSTVLSATNAVRLAAVVALVAGGWLAATASAHASSGGDHVEFTLAVDTAVGDNDQADRELSARTRQNVAEETATRIEQRLETIGVGDYEVEPTADNDVAVTVYGDYSPQTIRSAVIPSGFVEIRPVRVGTTPWLEVVEQLPDDTEFHHEPGSWETHSFFLFSSSPQTLHRAAGLLDDDYTIGVYPHEDGWRTLNLGDVGATHADVTDVRLHRNRTGAPFVSVSLTGEAVQQVRAVAGEAGASQLAVLVDGEVVALEHFHSDAFSESVTLSAPDHLQSPDARQQWARQVAGRLAVPIPVELAEFQE